MGHLIDHWENLSGGTAMAAVPVAPSCTAASPSVHEDALDGGRETELCIDDWRTRWSAGWDGPAGRGDERPTAMIRGTCKGLDVVVCGGCCTDILVSRSAVVQCECGARACEKCATNACSRCGRSSWRVVEQQDVSGGELDGDGCAHEYNMSDIPFFEGGGPVERVEEVSATEGTTTFGCDSCDLGLPMLGSQWRLCRCGKARCEACVTAQRRCGCGNLYAGQGHVEPPGSPRRPPR